MILFRKNYKDRQDELKKRFPFWQRLTLGDRFDKLVEEFADLEFIKTIDKNYTYKEAQIIINQLAKGFLRIGIKPRENVVLSISNCPEYIFITFALAKIGAVKVSASYRLSSSELEYIVEQSDAVCLIIGSNQAENLNGKFAEYFEGNGPVTLPNLRNVIIFPELNNNVDIRGTISYQKLIRLGNTISNHNLKGIQNSVSYPDEIIDIFYTSGTTGKPKGVMLTHDMLWRSAYANCLNRAFENGRRIFLPIPLCHVYGYVDGLLAVILVGGAIILQNKFDKEEALLLMAKAKANDILCVPAIAISLIDCSNRKAVNLSSLYAIYCSATETPKWLWTKLQQEFNIIEFTTGYGMTEVSGATVQTVPGDSLEIIATRVGRILNGECSGLPEFNYNQTQYKVIDPKSGIELPKGMQGELVCRGNVVTRGYYKQPNETYEMIDKDCWLKTGDLGIIHEDGYFSITGRIKDIYKIGGENVSPTEIERVIEENHKVLRAIVVGVPDRKMGEVGAAFIVIKPGETCTTEEIIQYCKTKLIYFKIPKYISFIKENELPMTKTQKIQRILLKDKIITELNLKKVNAI